MTERTALRRAALWMSGAIVCFSTMAVSGRALAFELDTFELMTYRSLVSLVVVVIGARLLGTWGEIRAHRMGLHFLRNVFHFAGQNLWFFAISVIPLAQVFAIEFTAPIWVMLGAPLILGERLTRIRLLSALIGFAGILVVARPDAAMLGAGQLAAALAAIGFAGSALFTRRLTRTETITSILFWLSLMQVVFGILCAGYDGTIALPSLAAWPWLVLVGCSGLAAHLCLTAALSLAPASVVMPLDFLRLPIIAMIGFLLYSEALDPWVFLGGAIIFGANWLNIREAGRPVTSL